MLNVYMSYCIILMFSRLRWDRLCMLGCKIVGLGRLFLLLNLISTFSYYYFIIGIVTFLCVLILYVNFVLILIIKPKVAASLPYWLLI